MKVTFADVVFFGMVALLLMFVLAFQHAESTFLGAAAAVVVACSYVAVRYTQAGAAAQRKRAEQEEAAHRARAESFFKARHGDNIDISSFANEHPEFIARVVELEARRRNARPREEQDAANRMLHWMLKLLAVDLNEQGREKLLLRPDLVQQLAAFEKSFGDKKPSDYELPAPARGGSLIPLLLPEQPRLFIPSYNSPFAPLRADAEPQPPVETTLTEK